MRTRPRLKVGTAALLAISVGSGFSMMDAASAEPPGPSAASPGRSAAIARAGGSASEKGGPQNPTGAPAFPGYTLAEPPLKTYVASMAIHGNPSCCVGDWSVIGPMISKPRQS